MKEDIKILEDLSFELKSFSLDKEGFKRAQAIENLLARYKELEKQVEYYKKMYKETNDWAKDNKHIPHID